MTPALSIACENLRSFIIEHFPGRDARETLARSRELNTLLMDVQLAIGWELQAQADTDHSRRYDPGGVIWVKHPDKSKIAPDDLLADLGLI